MDERAHYRSIKRCANNYIISLWSGTGPQTADWHALTRIKLKYCKLIIALCSSRELAFRFQQRGDSEREARHLENSKRFYEEILEFRAQHSERNLPAFPLQIFSEFSESENADPTVHN